MEEFRNTAQTRKMLQEVISSAQKGRGMRMDRYIYNVPMQGRGIGGIFAKLFRAVMPMAKSGIKTLVDATKPHIKTLAQKTANNVFQAGVKRLAQGTQQGKKQRRSSTTANKRPPNRISTAANKGALNRISTTANKVPPKIKQQRKRYTKVSDNLSF